MLQNVRYSRILLPCLYRQARFPPLATTSSLQTEEALKKLNDSILQKVKKTKSLAKELKTGYDVNNADVAKQTAEYSQVCAEH